MYTYTPLFMELRNGKHGFRVRDIFIDPCTHKHTHVIAGLTFTLTRYEVRQPRCESVGCTRILT